jgi:hypothetical protein
MSLDAKLASILFGLAFLFCVWAAVLCARPLIFRIAAKATHDFYVTAKGAEPRCATCPFNRHCPYSDGVTCHFAPKASGSLIQARDIL